MTILFYNYYDYYDYYYDIFVLLYNKILYNKFISCRKQIFHIEWNISLFLKQRYSKFCSNGYLIDVMTLLKAVLINSWYKQYF